jgi:hypothetical protein
MILPVGPASTRVFCGYAIGSLTREEFYKQLQTTFMPGTPHMLQPLGLAAYLPAVFDLPLEAGLPDEVALIVYASVPTYQAARNDSLSGRMYTHSHAGVFDMSRSRGQFPGSFVNPDKQAGTERWCWCAHDQPIEWQQGTTRVIGLAGTPAQGTMQETMLLLSQEALPKLTAAGVDQAIFVAAPGFCVIWLHSPGSAPVDLAQIGLLPPKVLIERDLSAVPAPMPLLNEQVTIAGPSAFTFRFVREPRFFL